MAKPFDRELLFKLLHEKKWNEVTELLYQHRDQSGRDPIMQLASGTLQSEFLAHARGLPAAERDHQMRHITLLIASNRRHFPEVFWRPVIELKLQTLAQLKSPNLASTASEFADEVPLARELLRRLRDERPEDLAHARRGDMSIRVVEREAGPKDLRAVVGLFKSPQERAFFDAMRVRFPQWLSYPNVAVATAIDVAALEGRISAEARAYAFRGVFDLVVFDPSDGFKPKHFFELDSSFHNAEDAGRRDRLKNEVCEAARVKLVRIRAFTAAEASAGSFAALIDELGLDR